MRSRKINLGVTAVLVILGIGIIFLWLTSESGGQGNLSSNNDEQQHEQQQKALVSSKPKEHRKPAPLDIELDESIFASEDSVMESFPRKLDVQFPSGQKISVSYENDGYDLLPPFTAENIGNYINLLKDLVEQEGSGVAANALWESLGDCSSSPRSEKAYRERYDNLLNSGNYTNGIDDQESLKLLPGSENHEIALTGLKLNYLKCRNIPDDLIAERAVWQDKAIELNSYAAITRKAAELVFDDPTAAHDLYLKAWDAGHIGVGSAVGFAFKRGTLNGSPDPVTAYAYTLAQNQIIKAFVEQSDSLNAIGLYNLSVSGLEGSENLTSEEFLQAEQIAIKLIQDNKNCCKGIWSGFEN